jgi:recombinational DNA repair ATPase RecF
VLGDEVFAWLSRQPDWQRDLARRVATQVELDDLEFADALTMVKSQFGVPYEGPSPSVQPIEREHVAPLPSSTAPLLLALGGLEGVGLIGDGDELTFGASGLTLIYGQNAVGKTSYVRALKVLCRTVDCDCKIRGNIYDASAAAIIPSARVKIDVDGTLIERRTTLDEDAAVTLSGLSVFDFACAELYVNAQNAVQYIPVELRLLARLAALQDRMRHAIANERQLLQDGEPSRDGYSPGTEVGRALAQLNGDTDVSALESLSVLTAEQADRILVLRGIIAAAAAPTARDDALASQREADEARSLAKALSELVERVGNAAAERLRTAAINNANARTALQLATEQLTGPLPGIGDGPWRLMWDAAREFVEVHGGVFPPAADERCPLCLQPVSVETARRMAHFQEHVLSTVQAAANAAATDLAEALLECDSTHAEACRTPLLTALSAREPRLAHAIDSRIAAVTEHLTAMTAEPASATGAMIDVESVTGELKAWADARSRHADDLCATEEPEKLKQAEAELAELEARQRLASELTLFTTWRAQLQTISALGEAHSALATNRITTAQRELTETEIARTLNAALVKELAGLSCTHLPVELSARTQVAETRVGLRLLANEPTNVSDIVSEGERRALALCFFFAELAVANDAGAIVVDDPVSSLDDDRRGYITDRLVAEARRRQVIVFTHDLPFVFDLRTKAKESDVPVHFQHVWRLGPEVGRVDDHLPFKTMRLRDRVGRLEKELSEITREPPPPDYEAVWRRISGFYMRIRQSWERAVEERLFAGVVERFERNVKTQQLKDVLVTPELIEEIQEGMTRASEFLHEEAYAAQVPLPSPLEMGQDLEALREFERRTRSS